VEDLGLTVGTIGCIIEVLYWKGSGFRDLGFRV
jgi:hypothetical protein